MIHFWDILHGWDQSLTLFVNSFHAPITDHFMVFFSDRAVWFPLYAVVAFFLVKRLGWKKGLVALVCVALCLLACDQTSNLLKYSVARLRPCYSDRMVLHGLHVLETRGSLFGFFSAHAANAFGFAAGTTTCFRYDTTHTYKGYIKCVYIWAALVSASRMFVGKHYFGDILVGAIVGSLWGWLLALGARWLFGKIDGSTQNQCRSRVPNNRHRQCTASL